MSTTDPLDGRGPMDDDAYHECAIADGELHSHAVVRCVAVVLDSDPLDLPPLGHSIDPDALDATFDRRTGGPPAHVSFSFASREVAVTPDRVYVRDEG